MLIDSNIIVYSIDINSPKHISAQKFLQEANYYLFAHQNILETLRILTHKKYPHPMATPKAIKAVTKATSRGILLHPQESTIIKAQELIGKYASSSDQIFDAYLAATALSWGINTIATDNEKDFQKFNEIKVYNPFK